MHSHTVTEVGFVVVYTSLDAFVGWTSIRRSACPARCITCCNKHTAYTLATWRKSTYSKL